MSYDYATILAQWDDYPPIRVRFSEDETGWARILDDTHVCLANIPITIGLMHYDIVTLYETDDSLPCVDEVQQRYYATQVSLAYVATPAQARDVEACKRVFHRLAKAAEQAGCSMEGLFPGAAMLNAPAGFSIATFIEGVGLDPALVQVYEQRSR